MCPGERRAVLKSSLLIEFRFFKCLRMTLFEANPFDLLLKKTKGYGCEDIL